MVARRLNFPGSTAAVEGGYRDHTGREHLFASDASWKFSSVEQMQGHGETPWYAETFDVRLGNRREGQVPTCCGALPSDVHPLSFAMPPQGMWIGQADGTPTHATFSYMLTLQDKVEDAWMRIVAGKPYALAINGIAIEREMSNAIQRS